MMLKFSTKIAALAMVTLIGFVGQTHGQTPTEFPSRPVTLVVTAAPGGIVDSVARSLAVPLSKALKQPVLVENKAGAGGTIAAGFVARSGPDGHTLLMVADSHTVSSMLYKLTYDPIKDFSPVSLIGTQPLILITTTSMAAATVPELVAQAKTTLGHLSFASTGPGSSSRLTAEMFKTAAGVDMVHVPYKGGAPAMNDLLAGQVPVMFIAAGTALQHIKSGRVKALAVTSPERLTALPEVPTVSSYYPHFEALAWVGLLAPAGTPTAVVSRLNAEVAKAVKTPEVRAFLESQAMSPRAGPPSQLADWLQSETNKYSEIIRTQKIKVD